MRLTNCQSKSWAIIKEWLYLQIHCFALHTSLPFIRRPPRPAAVGATPAKYADAAINALAHQ
jgi:hypothetical protein